MSESIKYAELARRIPLFRGIKPEDVHKIFSKGMTMTLEKDNVIFYQGSTGNQMFVILAGTVNLYDGKKQIAQLRSGAVFGEMALINNEPRSATAVAMERSQVFVLDETVFNRLMTKRVAIRMLLNVVGVLSERLRSMNKQVAQSMGDDASRDGT